MPRDHAALRRAVVAAACAMNGLGINQGSSGNVSVRAGKGFLITPTALPCEATTPDDIVAMTLDGGHRGSRRPSSEWRFHRDIYAARPDAGAVVHTHAVHATALACLRKPIPRFHYMVALAGGEDIRCAPYATYGTQELSDHALAALMGRKACLLANHGMIALGADLDAALALAVEVETLAHQYLLALQAGGPKLLTRAQMGEALAKFAHYRPG
ncbi:MAG: class II aldolase/adducin family protein [Proteobacteria bacterium]|nr:class II aldolase/adducin family protein [Pseudomonadota bacterium]MDA1071590.1 class II aldolase/adducin family protein [Pseudomonadota bacterium]